MIPLWAKWLIAAAVVAAIAGFGWQVNQWRHRAAAADAAEAALTTYKADVADRDRKAADELQAEQARAAQLSTDLSSLRDQYAKLARAAARAPITQSREVPPDDQGRCTVTTRSTAYRVCNNAAWSRDPAQLAACEASGGDATGEPAVPPARLVGPRDP